ncbi:hypothetical protein KIN20_028403 [Parelaphostrongylus tenuis]|uniref:Uncharacterized protein n=1 Tax=Parelaphostrongylus tenuis TaxID=148309 RepID=A0AAD5R0U8_PARTN|nr:hypothetical protein KIN20_028403 [Parelaphostrongylus tenuis]
MSSSNVFLGDAADAAKSAAVAAGETVGAAAGAVKEGVVSAGEAVGEAASQLFNLLS